MRISRRILKIQHNCLTTLMPTRGCVAVVRGPRLTAKKLPGQLRNPHGVVRHPRRAQNGLLECCVRRSAAAVQGVAKRRANDKKALGYSFFGVAKRRATFRKALGYCGPRPKSWNGVSLERTGQSTLAWARLNSPQEINTDRPGESAREPLEATAWSRIPLFPPETSFLADKQAAHHPLFVTCMPVRGWR